MGIAGKVFLACDDRFFAAEVPGISPGPEMARRSSHKLKGTCSQVHAAKPQECSDAPGSQPGHKRSDSWPQILHPLFETGKICSIGVSSESWWIGRFDLTCQKLIGGDWNMNGLFSHILGIINHPNFQMDYSGLMDFNGFYGNGFSHILGMSSSQLTKSIIFSEG